MGDLKENPLSHDQLNDKRTSVAYNKIYQTKKRGFLMVYCTGTIEVRVGTDKNNMKLRGQLKGAYYNTPQCMGGVPIYQHEYYELRDASLNSHGKYNRSYFVEWS